MNLRDQRRGGGPRHHHHAGRGARRGTGRDQDRRPVRQLHGRRGGRGAGAAPLSPLLAAIDAVTSTRRVGPAARPVRPAAGSTGWSGWTPSPTRRPAPLRDVRRPGRDRAARRGVLPAARACRDPRALPRPPGPSFELAGVDDPADQAQAGPRPRDRDRRTHWDKVRCRDLRQMYNLMGLDEFADRCPRLHWREFLAGAGIDERRCGSSWPCSPRSSPRSRRC